MALQMGEGPLRFCRRGDSWRQGPGPLCRILQMRAGFFGRSGILWHDFFVRYLDGDRIFVHVIEDGSKTFG